MPITLPSSAAIVEKLFVSRKRVLLWGASGFLGRNLLEQLPQYTWITPEHSRVDIEREIPAMNDVDVVINCVNCEDNLQAFINMTHLYSGKLIQIGSGAEYDHSLPIKNVTEDFDRKPFDSYGLGKYYISKQIEFRENIICLRPFGIFGKHENVNRRFISKAILDHNKGLPVTIFRDSKFSYVWVNDLVRIIEYFIEHKPKEKFYNVGGHQITLKNIAKQIGKYRVVLGGQGQEYTCDDTRVREETGIVYTPFKESLNKLKEFYASIQ